MRNFDADVFEIVDAGAPDSDGFLLRPEMRASGRDLFGRQGEA
jgi:hypothetical protein